jgi:hypothetical protein
VDFVDHNNKKVYEIKPDAHKNIPKVLAKQDYCIEWCKKEKSFRCNRCL